MESRLSIIICQNKPQMRSLACLRLVRREQLNLSTPKEDLDLIKQRLADAKEIAKND
ncbi:MAG: hypothetical protein ACRDBG_22030 [Waterburya sp.]